MEYNKKVIDAEDPAWPIIQRWIDSSNNVIQKLESNKRQGESILLQFHVTTRSLLGAIVWETGGLLIDHGWLRFLGSGHEHMQGNLRAWNTNRENFENTHLKDAVIVAYDVVGGFFALNRGAFPGKQGTVFYLAPDTLNWENLDMSYSELLHWGITNNLTAFYQTMRWPDWEKDTATMSGDQGISFYPFLWTNQETPLINRSRRIVPMKDLWKIQLNLSRQIKDLPDGTQIRIKTD